MNSLLSHDTFHRHHSCGANDSFGQHLDISKKMPRPFFHKAFDKWLTKNCAQFNYRPEIKLRRQGYIELSFRGITPKISVSITKIGASIAVDHKDACVDLLISWDLVARRGSDGLYFCALCLEPTMVESKHALWEAHCFEPLLQWVNQNLRTGQWLYVHISESGTSRAYLDTKGPSALDRPGQYNAEFLEIWPLTLLTIQ